VAPASPCYPSLLADDVDHADNDVDSVVLVDVLEDGGPLEAMHCAEESSAESACASPEAGRFVGIDRGVDPVGPTFRSDLELLYDALRSRSKLSPVD
jgi:hypothetical protein